MGASERRCCVVQHRARIRALGQSRDLNITQEKPRAKDLFLGIDLGGTKIVAGLVDRDGRIISRQHSSTQASKGREIVVRRLMDVASQLLTAEGIDRKQVAAIGVAAPGPIDARSGVVTAPPNLPGWRDVPLGQLIQDELRLCTSLENDGNAAALGEHLFGAGRGADHMIYVTASTGIGGGFILDGRLYRGSTGAAAEVGHMTILPHGPRCGCGNRGCLEALASGTAIAREARERVSRGAPTLIAELAEGDLNRISAEMVSRAAEGGDAEANEILDQAMIYLGVGMANLVNLFNPQLLVIGGGLTKMGARLFDPVRRIVDRQAFPAAASAVEITRAQLGDDVGLLGAAAVAMTAAAELSGR
jgi:glucokinase